MVEREQMCLIVENIADGLKDTIQDMDRKWKMYVSLHLKRCRLENEAEKLTVSMSESGSVGELGDLKERRSRVQSLNEEARSIRGELDKLDYDLTYLGGYRNGFHKYLEEIDSTFQALTSQS